MLRSAVVGLDIGTTSVKALIVDDNGETQYRISERLHLTTDTSGAATQNPVEILETVSFVMKSAFTEARRASLMIQRVGMSAAMHSLLAVSEDGAPKTDAITWMDTRAKDQAHALWNSDCGPTFYRVTGTPIHAMSPFVKLTWLRRQNPSLFDDHCRFVSIKELIWHAWFGEWVVDESMASATGLYDIVQRRWSPDVLQCIDLDESQLSSVVPTTYQKCAVKSSLLFGIHLLRDTQFCIGASDGVLANLALGVTDEKEMVLTAGTSLAVRTGSAVAITDVSFRPFCYRFDLHHLVVGAPSNSGGIVLDWLMRTLLGYEEEADAALNEFIRSAGEIDVDNLYCLPYIAGERAPLWNESARASLIGLHLGHGPVHVIRAAVEGILFNACLLIDSLSELTGQPVRITISGKLFDEPWVHQFCADLFGRPVRKSNLEDASTMGAILLAADSQTLTRVIHEQGGGDTLYPIVKNNMTLQTRLTEYRRLLQNLLP